MTDGGAPAARPAGSEGTNRERILAAARREFAAKGYRGATMRSIAAAAGVDVALPPHYFGNKDGLFAATLALPDSTQDLLAGVLAAPDDEQGERLTRAYLALWEAPETAEQMLVLARSALTTPVAAERLRTLIGGATTDPRVVTLLEGRREGFVLAMGHLVGLALTRYVVRVPAVAELPLEVLVARVAPAVQRHLSTPDTNRT